MTSVAAVIVTRNAGPWLPALLASIAAQSRPVDRLVAVDDGSTDATLGLLRSAGADVLNSACAATDVTTRIAANFGQGVRACLDTDLVVLGDHDDVWHPDRVAHQAGILEVWQDALMLASDGRLVDAHGIPLGGSLRAAFPVPADWDALAPDDRMRAALRRSLATGGASMIRPEAFPEISVPPGWLHDRWWSLVAVARNGLLLDDRAVIDYRVQPGQQVGLDTGAQAVGGVARLFALARQGGLALGRAGDLRQLRALATDPAVRAAISWRSAL